MTTGTWNSDFEEVTYFQIKTSANNSVSCQKIVTHPSQLWTTQTKHFIFLLLNGIHLYCLSTSLTLDCFARKDITGPIYKNRKNKDLVRFDRSLALVVLNRKKKLRPAPLESVAYICQQIQRRHIIPTSALFSGRDQRRCNFWDLQRRKQSPRQRGNCGLWLASSWSITQELQHI